MTVFTDISSAIEEARFLRETERYHYKVVQKRNGIMHVVKCQNESHERILRKMYTTRHDRASKSNSTFC